MRRRQHRRTASDRLARLETGATRVAGRLGRQLSLRFEQSVDARDLDLTRGGSLFGLVRRQLGTLELPLGLAGATRLG
jgi:hypothetical protein